MNFAIIFTVILGFCTLGMFISGMGKMIPIGVKIVPLFAIAALWGYTIIHQMTGKAGIAGVLLMIFFYFVLITMALPAGLGMWFIAFLDREQNIPAVTLGNPSGSKSIFIIYHPGGTSFTTNTLKQFGGEFSKTDYKIVLYSANKNLKINIKDAAAVGFTSPVYGAQIRPPLENYIKNNDLSGIKSFILLTGGGPINAQQNELDSTEKLLKEKEAKVFDREKFIQYKETNTITTDPAAFARKIKGEL